MATNKPGADEIWREDVLGRRQDAEFLMRFLCSRIEERAANGEPKSYVLNVDAKWGDGKSFFMERLAKALDQQGHLVAQVNAWKDDHADDPLLSVMAAIDVAVQPLIKGNKDVAERWQQVRHVGARVALAAAKGASLHWLRKLLGEGLDDAVREGAEAVHAEVASVLDERAEIMLADYAEGQRSIATFRAELARVLDSMEERNIPAPLFVLVDELDRCRPPYAIALLERIKHLFDIDNVVFVIATDTEQLQHAVGAVYGHGFDSKRYLLRFFDRSYAFDEPDLDQFVGALLLASPLDPAKVSIPPKLSLQTFITAQFDAFGMSLRDCAQCHDIVRTVVTAWNLPVPIELSVLLPLAVGHHQKMSPEISDGFVNSLKGLPTSNLITRKVIDHTYVDGNGRYNDIKVSIFNLLNSFVQIANIPLDEIMNQGRPEGLDIWVHSRIREEIFRLHDNSIEIGTISALSLYPGAVRTAGRMMADRD